MRKTKNLLLIIAAIIAVGCLLYIPHLNDLGFYRDDWNNLYNATVYGSEMLKEHYASDRPADGWLLSLVFMVFGTNNNGYLIWNLCCRILGSVFLSLALLNVWPRTPKMAGLAGLFAVTFPGFLQQVDGIAYLPHQTAMFCFMISLWLTSLACLPGQKKWNVLFTFMSILFSFVSLMLMEYYIGMEIFRFGLIYLMNRERAEDGKIKAFFKCLLSYLPYLIPVLGFAAWRIFVFKADRSGADLIEDMINPLLAAPRDEGMKLLVRYVKNVWKLFVGVWTIPAYNLINGLDKKTFLTTMIPALIIFGAGYLLLFLVHRKKTDESIRDAGNESAKWLWYGLLCGMISIMPMVIAGRDIKFEASLDRFTWVGMIGTIVFLVGLLGSLRNRALRNLLSMAMLLVAVFTQWQNQKDYIELWNLSKDYLQQLIWRAPSLEKGTTIVSGGTLAEEDYDIFAPVAMIYYPENQQWYPTEPGEPENKYAGMHWTPIGAEVLTTGTVGDVILGNNSYREIRKIWVDKDYDHLLAITKPYGTSCLRVIDGKNPIYSSSDWTKIPEIGYRSQLSQIITDPEAPVVQPFFLPEELEHGWCYYYEKMELALQMEDPEAAAALADEASAKRLNAGDPVEWIPVVEAYAQTGRSDDAVEAAEKLMSDGVMGIRACSYFLAKDDISGYESVITKLCGAQAVSVTDTETAADIDEEEPAESIAEEPAEFEESDVLTLEVNSERPNDLVETELDESVADFVSEPEQL